jgi:CRP/FNR family cyclic AMP-dependent transcriptional regulator
MSDGIGFDELLAFLRDSPFFQGFEPGDLMPLLEIVQVRDVPAGKALFAQGDLADAFYVVYRGVVRIDRTREDGSTWTLGRCETHACFGEQAIIEAVPRSASAIMAEAGVVLRFPSSKFERLLATGNRTAVKLVLQLARTTSAYLRERTALLERLGAATGATLDPI